MGFKRFVTLYLAVLMSVSAFVVVAAPRLQTKNEIASSHHFSVRWMGFAPTDCSNEYPEYYVCINNLKDDPLRMQIALQIKNQEASAFYFKVDQFAAPPSGWAIQPRYVGLIQVDETGQFVYDNVSRSRPVSIPQGRLTESISLMVQAYYDSGYTSLYSQDDFTVAFNFLDLTSTQWTVIYHDNFDDKQTRNWTSVSYGGGSYSATIDVTDIYYRSFQYSLRLDTYASWNCYCCGGYKKIFDIGSVQEVYLIYSIRSEDWLAHYDRGVTINGTTCFRSDNPALERNVWFQVALRLRPSETNIVEIWSCNTGGLIHTYSYLDDVYVIAK